MAMAGWGGGVCVCWGLGGGGGLVYVSFAHYLLYFSDFDQVCIKLHSLSKSFISNTFFAAFAFPLRKIYLFVDSTILSDTSCQRVENNIVFSGRKHEPRNTY